MATTFLATLSPMLMLFFCIAIGFLARKTEILPENAGRVMAKLETWIFVPALNFVTMMNFFTVESVTTHATNLLLSVCGVGTALLLAVFLARFFVKEKTPERGIYMYALAFANSGYLGDPIILSLFGDLALSYYKLYCLPISVVIYTWGISVLVPHGEKKESPFKKLLNAPTLALLLGIAAGLLGVKEVLPVFLTGALSNLKACMGPVAMLLAGFTVAAYPFGEMLRQKRVYLAALLRLFVLPAVLVATVFGVKTLSNLVLGTDIDNSVLYLTFFATASALGMNTIVFPEAYGGNPKTGAAMTLISHTLAILSIPLLYALMVFIFGPFLL